MKKAPFKNSFLRNIVTGILIFQMLIFSTISVYGLEIKDSYTKFSPNKVEEDSGYTGLYFGGKLYRVVENNADDLVLFYDGRSIGDRQYQVYRPDEKNLNFHNNWSESDICKYLNGEGGFSGRGFISTFSPLERAAILPYGDVEKTNQNNFKGSIRIDQKIVLPSLEEVMDGGTWNMRMQDRENGSAKWSAFADSYYLRSPSVYAGDNRYCARVGATGIINEGSLTVFDFLSIRPALRIDKTKVHHYMIGYSHLDGANPYVFEKLENAQENARPVLFDPKLTLRVSSLEILEDGFELFYEDACVRKNTYLSVIFVDSEGRYKYYGRIKKIESEDGTAKFNYPENFSEGLIPYIFEERVNSKNKSNYSGEFIDLSPEIISSVISRLESQETADEAYSLYQNISGVLPSATHRLKVLSYMYNRFKTDFSLSKKLSDEYAKLDLGSIKIKDEEDGYLFLESLLTMGDYETTYSIMKLLYTLSPDRLREFLNDERFSEFRATDSYLSLFEPEKYLIGSEYFADINKSKNLESLKSKAVSVFRGMNDFAKAHPHLVKNRNEFLRKVSEKAFDLSFFKKLPSENIDIENGIILLNDGAIDLFLASKKEVSELISSVVAEAEMSFLSDEVYTSLDCGVFNKYLGNSDGDKPGYRKLILRMTPEFESVLSAGFGIKVYLRGGSVYIPKAVFSELLSEAASCDLEFESNNGISVKYLDKDLDDYTLKDSAYGIHIDSSIENTAVFRNGGEIDSVYDTLKVLLSAETSSFGVFRMGLTNKIKYLDISDLPPEEIEAITALSSKKIINGFEDRTYRPDGSLRRSEFAKVLSVALNLKPVTDRETYNPFLDVTQDKWYYDYVVTCYEKGLLKGRSEDVFDPDDFVTREEVVVVLSRIIKDEYENVPNIEELNDFFLNNYNLKKISNWALDEYALSLLCNLVEVTPFEEYSGNQPLNRAEMAKILYRFIGFTEK